VTSGREDLRRSDSRPRPLRLPRDRPRYERSARR
jgi:hypothetical protein